MRASAPWLALSIVLSLGCGQPVAGAPSSSPDDAHAAPDTDEPIDDDAPTATDPARPADTVPDDVEPEDAGHVASAFALDAARDALLGDDRCAAWAALDDDARAVFLVLTDLLGHRTLLADGSRAIEHVTLLAIRGRQQDGCVRCCGDSEHNRLYVSIDDALAHALRAHELAAWRASTDLAGPHDPFDLSLETVTGYPRGQLHLFSSDAAPVPLGRAGVEDVVDTRALELDMDFNLIHESAPLCSYLGGEGTTLYAEDFAAVGDHAAVDLDYAPTGC